MIAGAWVVVIVTRRVFCHSAGRAEWRFWSAGAGIVRKNYCSGSAMTETDPSGRIVTVSTLGLQQMAQSSV